MRNEQNNLQNVLNNDVQVDGIFAGVRGRDARLVKRTYSKPLGTSALSTAPQASSSEPMCLSHSSSEHEARHAARSVIAARHLPGPIWGRLVIMRAITS
jgi:hypothetical protein